MKENGYNIFKVSRKLPQELAQSILNLQFQIDTDVVDQEKISLLLSHYSQAISFYWEFKDQRYTFYQEKIKKLFLHKQVVRCLNRTKSIEENKNQNNNSMIRSQIQLAKTTAYQQAKNLINSYKIKEKQNKQRVVSMVVNQKQNILERVRIRSKSKNKAQKNESNLKKLERQLMEMHLNRS